MLSNAYSSSCARFHWKFKEFGTPIVCVCRARFLSTQSFPLTTAKRKTNFSLCAVCGKIIIEIWKVANELGKVCFIVLASIEFVFLGKLKYIWFLRQWENHMEIWITLTAPTEYLLPDSCNIKTNLNDDWRTRGKQIKHKFPIKLLFLGYVMRKQCSRETSALDFPTISLIRKTTW